MSFVSDFFKKCGQKLVFIAAVCALALDFVVELIYAIEGVSMLSSWIGFLLGAAFIALAVYGKMKNDDNAAVIGLLLTSGWHAFPYLLSVFNGFAYIGGQFDYNFFYGMYELFLAFTNLAAAVLPFLFVLTLLGKKLPAIIGDVAIVVVAGTACLAFICAVIGSIAAKNQFIYALATILGIFGIVAYVVFYAASTRDDAPAAEAAPAEESAE